MWGKEIIGSCITKAKDDIVQFERITPKNGTSVVEMA